MNRNTGPKEKTIDSTRFDSEKIKEFLEFKEFQKLSRILEEQEKQEMSPSPAEINIPVSIFNDKLGAMETICKYLKENLALDNKRIAELLNRNTRIVWNSCNSAKKKLPKRFNVTDSEVSFPTAVFENDKLSALENIVSYLKEEKGLTYHKIAVLLKRDDRTIWTVYNRGLKKR